MANPIGGTVTIEPELWRADVNGNLLQNLTHFVEEGSVDWDESRSGGTMMGCSFTLSRPNLLTAYRDFIIPFQTLRYDSGTVVRTQVGHFVVLPSGESHTAIDSRSVVTGVDMTYRLSMAKSLDRVNYASGTNLRAILVSIMGSVGITKYNFPSTTKVLSADKSFSLGTPMISQANHFAHRFGWYMMFMERDGSIRSLPYRNLTTSQPSKLYTEDHLVDVLEVEAPPSDKFANVVILTKDVTDGSPLISIARQDNPAVPWSTAALNMEIVYGPENIDDAEDQTALDLLAQSRLDNSAAYEKVVTITTLPDPRQDVRRTVDLYLQGDKAHLNGRYRVKAWRIGFTPDDALTQVTLGRVARFVEGVLVPGQGLLDI